MHAVKGSSSGSHHSSLRSLGAGPVRVIHPTDPVVAGHSSTYLQSTAQLQHHWITQSATQDWLSHTVNYSMLSSSECNTSHLCMILMTSVHVME